MIRIVPTGDLGLDVLTGGGWRLVKRFEGRESATVVVRGGPGAGKTLMGIHVALELAKALGGDVAVAGIEILPTEYIAQLQSARPSLRADQIIQLPAQAVQSDEPRVFVGLMTGLDPQEPEFVEDLEELTTAVEEAGGKPVVFIVDSLIEGYGIGSSTHRIDVDAVMKFAVNGGWGLVLCEEQTSDAPSPWVFAADTVLQLGVESRERGRWIEVSKHRFGPSATGRHELELAGVGGPEVFPEPSAWLNAPDVGSRGEARRPPPLEWTAPLTAPANQRALAGSLVYVTNAESPLVQVIASSLRSPGEARRSLQFTLDPLQSGSMAVRGPRYALRSWIATLRQELSAGPLLSSVTLGDLKLVLDQPNAPAWIEAIRTLAVIAGASGVPIVTYDGRRHATTPHHLLTAYADVIVYANVFNQRLSVSIESRFPRGSYGYEWPLPAA